jgi:hypothetical protein
MFMADLQFDFAISQDKAPTEKAPAGCAAGMWQRGLWLSCWKSSEQIELAGETGFSYRVPIS